MAISITLFESIVILIITGVFVVAWWGVQRLVKINDDEARLLEEINKRLTTICGRLEKSEMWANMHSKQDDERHQSVMKAQEDLRDSITKLSEQRMGQ